LGDCLLFSRPHIRAHPLGPKSLGCPEKEKPAKKPATTQAPAPGAAPGTSIKGSAINDSNVNAALSVLTK